MALVERESEFLVLLDVEGLDGTQQRNPEFERRVALLTVSVAQTVLFNMRWQDFNQHEGSGAERLKALFTVSMPYSWLLLLAAKDVLCFHSY